MVKRVFVQVHKSVMADIYVHREERLPRCSVTDFSLSWTALMGRVYWVRRVLYKFTKWEGGEATGLLCKVL